MLYLLGPQDLQNTIIFVIIYYSIHVEINDSPIDQLKLT